MPAKEQDVAGMGCILHFFTDMYNCIDAVNTYVIGLDETELKYPKPKTEDELKKFKLSEEVETYVQQLRVNARFTIMRCHLQLTGISQVIAGFDTKKLNAIYEKILTTVTPEKKDCQEYITALYTCFVTSVLKDMLRDIEAYSNLIKEE